RIGVMGGDRGGSVIVGGSGAQGESDPQFGLWSYSRRRRVRLRLDYNPRERQHPERGRSMSAITMNNLSRRQCCAGLLTVLGGLAAGGCLTISPQEEQKLGDKEAKEVERTVGLIRDPRLVEYVQ